MIRARSAGRTRSAQSTAFSDTLLRRLAPKLVTGKAFATLCTEKPAHTLDTGILITIAVSSTRGAICEHEIVRHTVFAEIDGALEPIIEIIAVVTHLNDSPGCGALPLL